MFDNSAWLAWLGVAFVCGAIEAATVNFIFIMLAGGAVGGAVAAAFGAGFPIQAVVASLVAVLLLGVVRPRVMHRFKVPGGTKSIGVAANIGRTAYVLETVSTAGGRVSLAGETWTARTHEDAIAPGEQVRIVAIDGATAVVARPSVLPGTDRP
jgi:membrane protein implicated in regulation of membrane protease activity